MDAPEAEEAVYVRMRTSEGDIILELDRGRAPKTVKNFVTYAKDGFYDGTIFHRVIPNFMIQGGGFTADLTQKSVRDPIVNEWENGLKNRRGTIAMARLGGRADSATSQFFINVKDNTALDSPRDGAAYAVFGRVIRGMPVVDAVRVKPTQPRGRHGNVPVEPVTIETVEVISKETATRTPDPE
ncbi:MAG: peptidyl-prolyl cis-trans isomerase [Phycisphaerales bacterium]|nr:peptidyl-prolyl cis-trans isomerase [Phycisphaerales bacterium]